ncbi:hypothetical protein GCM10009540_02090 [Streptomyces turgidiscabies]
MSEKTTRGTLQASSETTYPEGNITLRRPGEEVAEACADGLRTLSIKCAEQAHGALCGDPTKIGTTEDVPHGS